MLLALVVATGGCAKKKEAQDAAHDVGGNFVKSQIKQPIARASAAIAATERLNPALLDTATNVYHKPGCKNANADTMEMTSIGAVPAAATMPNNALEPVS